MRLFRDKVLDHATTRLAGIEQVTDPYEICGRFRTFLKVEDQRLRMAHRSGASGLETAVMRSFVLDTLVERAFRAAAWPGEGGEFLGGAKNGCAVIALGGYGRGELAPCSDLDLLFLHTGRRTHQMRQLIERVLRLLWDTGLTIGHSFRTVNESIAAVRIDPHMQTALVTTRLLTGNGALYSCLLAALESERRKKSDAFISAVRHGRDERYLRFGESVCLQEPNVKESAGGIRDLHTAIWLGYARYGCRTLQELRARDLISGDEQKTAESAYDFMLRVRCEAHLLTNRKTDRLALDLQPALAEKFGYTSQSHLLASETFMRDYYRQARQLQLFSETILARTTETGKRSARWFNWQRPLVGLKSGTRVQRGAADPFSIGDGCVQLESPDADERISKNPLLLFDAFALAQAADVPFSHKLREVITRSLAAVNRDFRASPEAGSAFLKILRRRGRVGRALRLMHDVGFLGRYLPEFGRISLLIQHDLYHRYTIDEHTLRAIDALDDLDSNRDKQSNHLRAVFDEIEDVALLYLSVLLHDIGKGQGRGHVERGVQISGRICRRLHLSASAQARVLLMVKHHITMAHIAQRRDLNEQQVILDFASDIMTVDSLGMLLLLTYADLSGVAPGVWSEWKGSLLLDLYDRTRKELAGSDEIANDPQEEAHAFKESVILLLKGELPLSEIERHLALLPDRYQRTMTPEAVAGHLQLIEHLGADALGLRWRPHTVSATELTICARDRHGLFADIAGTLTTQGIEILSAELNTREDGIVIDVLLLREAATRRAIEEYRWPSIERALRSSILGEKDVAAMVETWRTKNKPRRSPKPVTAQVNRRELPHVSCDNGAARESTIVEVRAFDQPGLAYTIASSIVEFKYDIVCAKITTDKNDAFDVFYITDDEGMKLAEPAMRSLEEALHRKLSTSNGALAGATIDLKHEEIDG